MNFSRNCMFVLLAALLAALGVRAQQHEIEHAAPSIVPSFVPSVPWKRQLSSPRTRAHGLPRGRADAPKAPTSSMVTPSPVAARRYVFGRMDLATGSAPDAVATGVFNTGGPLGIAVANFSANTV